MKKWLMLVIPAVLVVAGVSYWFAVPHVQPLAEKSLNFAEASRTTIRDIVSATGIVEPRELVVVASESAGTVMRLSVRIGDIVQEGSELAQLDDRKIKLKVEEAQNGIQTAEAAYLQAKAQWTQAQAALEQTKAVKVAAQRQLKVQEELSKIGGIRAELEQAKAQHEAAEAGIQVAQAGIHMAEAGVKLATAKKQAAATALKEADLVHNMSRILVPDISRWSPGGHKREFLVLERKVQEGQMVGPQSGPLFVLAGNLNLVEVHAQVAEGDINKIRRGLKAVFNISGYSDKDVEFQGTVKEIRPLASNIKGAVYYDTVIEVKNEKDATTGEWQLRPGMTAPVDIIRREHKDVWRVPSAALNFTMDEAFQSEAAKTRITAWKKRADARDWQTLWLWDDAARQVQPVFVRIGGLKNGEPGLKDSEGNEVLEWEPGKEPAGPVRLIVGTPPARAPASSIKQEM